MMIKKLLFAGVGTLLLLTGCRRTIPFTDPGELSYISGYEKTIAGEVLRYHSPQPEAKDALLVRSEERDQFIAWETAAVPENFSGDTARFIWMEGIDVNREKHRFDLFVNGAYVLSFTNPATASRKEWVVKGKNGMNLFFRNVMVDKHGDLMGYVTLNVPASQVKPGEPLRLKIMGEEAGSRVWYMTFRYAPGPKLEIEDQEAVVWKQGKKMNLIRVDLVHLGKPEEVNIRIGKIDSVVMMNTGLNTWRFYLPVVKKEKKRLFLLTQNGRVLSRETIRQVPVREKTIYLLHHSHVDIGYTNVQSVVQQIQWDNLKRAVRYAEESQDYPKEARFKWNVEVMWPLETYLHHASPEEKKGMIRAIKKGWIELDALYANELTGLCRPEELMALVTPARQLADSIGVPLQSAMISDIPGYTWGLIPVLAQNGIRYFSIGTNTFDRIGHILPDMGDKPFYWETPSGKGKVLCWVHGKGYSMFHAALENHHLDNALHPKAVFAYLKELKEKGYPYDMVALRYNIGSDNGPPDSLLAEAVRRWNEKYVSPKMVISTVSRLFGEFERKYGGSLPVLRGDLTPYWSDGAASSAMETAMNRASAERIVQASTLYTLFHEGSDPQEDFYHAWKNILLYDEHTWGSWNSISEPESPFTLSQWERKKKFALDADRETKELLGKSMPVVRNAGGRQITVLNTLSWERSGVVALPGMKKGICPVLYDEHEEKVPCQQNSDGSWVFFARDVPAFGRKIYRLEEKWEASQQKVTSRSDRLVMENDHVKVTVDGTSGSILSLWSKDTETELADTLFGQGLNGYVFVPGRKPQNLGHPGAIRIVAAADGPVYQSVVFSSPAPGTLGLVREIRAYRHNGMIEIINRFDKRKNYFPESLFFTFPFRLPEGRTLIDIAWGAYRPEKDQLPGSCKNYFTVQRWVDVSDSVKGITWFTPDAPMIELGGITTDANQTGWLRHIRQPEQHVLSYVMNNYWGTNYKASQEGPAAFRYLLIPHGRFNRSRAKKQGMEIAQPLLAVRGVPEEHTLRNIPVPGNDLIITYVHSTGDGVLLRVFNPSGQKLPLKLQWKDAKEKEVYLTDPQGKKAEKWDGKRELLPLEIVTMIIKD